MKKCTKLHVVVVTSARRVGEKAASKLGAGRRLARSSLWVPDSHDQLHKRSGEVCGAFVGGTCSPGGSRVHVLHHHSCRRRCYRQSCKKTSTHKSARRRKNSARRRPTLQEDLKLANTKAHVVVKIAHVVRLRCKKTSNLQIQKRTSSCKQRTARHHSPHLSPNHNHNQASGTRRRRGAQASHPRRTSCRAIAPRSSLATDV